MAGANGVTSNKSFPNMMKNHSLVFYSVLVVSDIKSICADCEPRDIPGHSDLCHSTIVGKRALFSLNSLGTL